MAMPPSSEALSPQASANTSAYGKCATSPLKSRRCATGSSPATEQGRILRPQNGDGASRRSAGGRKHHIVGQLGGGNLHYKVWLDKYAAPEAETLWNAVMDAVEDGALDLGGMFSADLRRRASRAPLAKRAWEQPSFSVIELRTALSLDWSARFSSAGRTPRAEFVWLPRGVPSLCH